MTVFACGDNAVIEHPARGEVALVSSRGSLASWGGDDDAGPRDFTALCATLAEPPRLAVAHRARLALLDPTTGAVHRSVPGTATALLGFAPGGAHLLARVDGDLCVVDEAGAARPVRTPDDLVLEADSAVFSPDGARALVWSALSGQPRVAVVDVGAARVRHVWARRATAAVVDARFTRAVIVNAPDEGVLVEMLEIDIDRFSALYRAPRARHIRGLAANRALTTVALHDSAGDLHVLRRRTALDWKHARAAVGDDAVLVDVDRDRVVCHRRSLRVQRLDGAVVASLEGATRVCFAGAACPGVDAAFLRGGALHVVERGAVRMLEGAGGLRDVAPHPRGVIAVDGDDCAHVFDLVERGG